MLNMHDAFLALDVTPYLQLTVLNRTVRRKRLNPQSENTSHITHSCPQSTVYGCIAQTSRWLVADAIEMVWVTKQPSPHEGSRSLFVSSEVEKSGFDKDVFLFEAYLHFIFCAIIRPKSEQQILPEIAAMSIKIEKLQIGNADAPYR